MAGMDKGRSLSRRFSIVDPQERGLARLEARLSQSPMFDLDDRRRVLKVSTNHEIANPSALGLFGFSLTTALLQGAVTGISGKDTVTWAVAFAFAFGGTAQVVAGLIDFRRNNMFGGVAFSSFGYFWWAFGLYEVFTNVKGLEAGDSLLPESEDGEAFMLAAMGCLTTVLALCACAMNVVLVALFWSLAALFFLLVGGLYNHTLHQFAGWWGLAVAGIAFYAAAAALLNDTYGREVLPMFHLTWNKRRLEKSQDVNQPLDILDLPGNRYWYFEESDKEANSGRASPDHAAPKAAGSPNNV